MTNMMINSFYELLSFIPQTSYDYPHIRHEEAKVNGDLGHLSKV
jgi:hypothetical protein